VISNVKNEYTEIDPLTQIAVSCYLDACYTQEIRVIIPKNNVV